MHNLSIFFNDLTELIKSVANFVFALVGLSAIISSAMPQAPGTPHKKNNQGFASSEYNPQKKRAAQSRGGKAKVAKGFARMSPERRREVARKGGLA